MVATLSVTPAERLAAEPETVRLDRDVARDAAEMARLKQAAKSLAAENGALSFHHEPFLSSRGAGAVAGSTDRLTLSQGITRNLLVDLKHIFRRSRFAGEEPFAGGIISVQSQSDGVRDGASWFWEDAQPPSGALQVRDSIESVAVLFRTVRYSDSPSECDLCAFSVPLNTLTHDSRRTLQVAEDWSYLIRVKEGRRNKNNDQVDALYQLGPMLAPRWEVSEHRRGSMELTTDLANAIFDPARRASLAGLMKRRVSRLFTPTPETNARLL